MVSQKILRFIFNFIYLITYGQIAQNWPANFILQELFLVILIAKSTVTINSGEAGVLYQTFGGGVVTDEPPLGEGFHFVAPWNKVFVYEVRQQSLDEKMQVLSSNGLGN